METQFSYRVNEVKIPNYKNISIEDFLFDKIETNTIRVVVTPFDDLKDSFDRLIQSNKNYICLNSIAIIDVVNLFQKLVHGIYDDIEFVFVSYENFEIARANMIGQSSVSDQIEHLVAFMISAKFESFRKSLSAVVEFLMTSDKYMSMCSGLEQDVEYYFDLVRNHCEIKTIILEEVNDGDY